MTSKRNIIFSEDGTPLEVKEAVIVDAAGSEIPQRPRTKGFRSFELKGWKVPLWIAGTAAVLTVAGVFIGTVLALTLGLFLIKTLMQAFAKKS